MLDHGTILELDRPFTLLQNKEGALYKMVQQMGQAEAAALLESARQVKKKKNACLWLDVKWLFSIPHQLVFTDGIIFYIFKGNAAFLTAWGRQNKILQDWLSAV